MSELKGPSTLILSLNRALSGEVTPNMRAALIGQKGNEIQIRFIYYAEPSEAEIETMNVIGGEVIADFGEHEAVSELYEVVPAAAISVREGEHLVYRRKD